MSKSTDKLREELRAAVLYAKTYADQELVIKFGAEVYRDKKALEDVVTANVTLKQLGCNVLNMHGGGSYIDEALKERGLFIDKVDGKRPTTKEGLAVATEILRNINLDIVQETNRIAKGLQFEDEEILGQGEGGFNGGYIKAVPESETTYTGVNPVANAHKLLAFRIQSVIPYFYSICAGPDSLLNVNADDAAAAMAVSVKAARLLLCSDVAGIQDRKGVMGPKDKILSSIFTDQIPFLTGKIDGLTGEQKEAFNPYVIITDGMIPKAESAALTAEQGVGVVILKGENILTELFTKSGGGTLIRTRPEGKRNEVDDYLDSVDARLPGILPQRSLG